MGDGRWAMGNGRRKEEREFESGSKGRVEARERYDVNRELDNRYVPKTKATMINILIVDP